MAYHVFSNRHQEGFLNLETDNWRAPNARRVADVLLECQIFRMGYLLTFKLSVQYLPASFLRRPYIGVMTQTVSLSSNYVSSVLKHGLFRNFFCKKPNSLAFLPYNKLISNNWIQFWIGLPGILKADPNSPGYINFQRPPNVFIQTEFNSICKSSNASTSCNEPEIRTSPPSPHHNGISFN